METLGHHSLVLAQVPDSEVLTVAAVSAKFFKNYHERAMGVPKSTGYLSGQKSLICGSTDKDGARTSQCIHNPRFHDQRECFHVYAGKPKFRLAIKLMTIFNATCLTFKQGR
jgi:hypothetical protein